MQTYAHPPLPAHWPQAEYTGTLVRHAEARTAVLECNSHAVPVLCLEIRLDSKYHNTLNVEQPFPEGHFAQCQAAAHQLKKGVRVTVQAPLVGLRLVARNASHIHVTPDAAPNDNPQPSPDLFEEQAA